MTIEVKQLLVKSTVQDVAAATDSATARPMVNHAALKEELLAECRRMLLELLRERKER